MDPPAESRACTRSVTVAAAGAVKVILNRPSPNADARAVSPQSLRGLPAPATRIRRRRAVARRGRMLAPLAAAAAITAVTVGVTTLSPLGQGGGAGTSMPAGMPRFYVISHEQFARPDIGSTATGQLTGTLQVPRGHWVESLAPLAGDDSYIALVEPAEGYPGPARLEQFSIRSNGRPTALRPLDITVPGAIPQFTVTPDGHTIAFYYGVGPDNKTRIEVVNRLTGQIRTWTGCGCSADTRTYPFIMSISASGRLLAVEARPFGNGVRLLQTTSAPGSYTRHSRLVLPNADWAVLSPSGTTLYACLARPRNLSTWVSYSVATGRQHTIAQWRRGSPCAGEANSSRGYVLNPPGTDGRSPAIALDARTGRVIPLPDFAVGGGGDYLYYW